MPAPAPAVRIDGDAILALLEREAEAPDRGPPPPVGDIPPALDRVFEDIIREYFARQDRPPSASGGGPAAAALPAAVRALKARYTEYAPSPHKGKAACLSLFRDRRPLGEGRFGVVYDVEDPSCARPNCRFAVKTVFLYPSCQRALYDNLVSEIEIGRAMGEAGLAPRVRAVHWCEQEGGLLVMLVTDLMSHGDLARFSQRHAVTAAHLRAIQAKFRKMHRLGYVHNDVHARNVLVHAAGEGRFEFFLSDFGFARPETSKARHSEEMARVRALSSMVDRDRLRGLLARMAADGRIRTSVRFSQSAPPSSTWVDSWWYSSSESRRK